MCNERVCVEQTEHIGSLIFNVVAAYNVVNRLTGYGNLEYGECGRCNRNTCDSLFCEQKRTIIQGRHLGFVVLFRTLRFKLEIPFGFRMQVKV